MLWRGTEWDVKEPMIQELRLVYPSIYGTPNIGSVETDIFRIKYFTHCSSCTFCNDWCCSFGVDVDIKNLRRIEQHAAGLEQFTGIPKDRWFVDEFWTEEEYPGGSCTRTQTNERGCIFLNKNGRGCMLHSYSIEKGIDYHELKPMISCLFPLTYDGGALVPAVEIDDKSLVCLDSGETLYRGVREEVRYYFGDAIIDELDELERTVGEYAKS
ncbi:MAG: hypothetical protein L0Y80_12730 [Ignavibacteriae bacterium]|nr:hypothetical protein [Ignavibacteriota bacterium]